MSGILLADLPGVLREAPAYALGPIAALIALAAAAGFGRSVLRRPAGDPVMIEIAQAVRQGAMAYLRRQYRVVGAVVGLLVLVLVMMGIGDVQPVWSAVGVPVAAALSALCGWIGMTMATSASARTAFAARTSLDDALSIAFRAGAVMGLVVAAFALLDVSIWFLAWSLLAPAGFGLVEITSMMLSFGLGASIQALYARVGGGIYTKAADVGADLVGKVEAGIPEDDPRNPATIADNVGDNVGDIAGMGADLYESYYASILAAMALGAAAALGMSGLEIAERAAITTRLVAAPVALAGAGIIASLIGILVVRGPRDAGFRQLLRGLRLGVWCACVLLLCGAAVLLWSIFRGIEAVSGPGIFGAAATGLCAGLVIAWSTEYSTSDEHRPTLTIAEQAQTGPATVIIAGMAVGMISTWVPLATIVLAILGAFAFAGGAGNLMLGLYGVAIAAVGMLGTLGITLATDAYGPIADNASGNAQMSDQPPFVRQRTEMLAALGNTTAATGKGFAIGSAALTAVALLAAYVFVAQSDLAAHLTPGAAEAAEIRSGTGALSAGPGEPIAARYVGRGRFRAVHLRAEGDQPFAGLIIGRDDLVSRLDREYAGRIVPGGFRGQWQEGNRAFVVHWHQLQGPAGDEDFVLVRGDQASMRQILAFFDVTLMSPAVLGGLFLGVLLSFTFCALTIRAVGRAAYRMMNECRRQLGIMREAFRALGMSAAEIADPARWPRRAESGGRQYPDPAECVAISTAGALREMIVPALLAIAAPVAVGLVLGVGGVMGLLAGGLTSGIAVAIFMANAGGAWDSAKRYIERGHYGGKGSSAHKAGVVGDTVGDPFKDTAGPSLSILIKIIAIMSVVFAGLTVRYGPLVSLSR